MAKPENDVTTTKKQQPKWETTEELLLACAVHRHGTDSWTSVSLELQKRSPNHHRSPSACRTKYFELKRRFTQQQQITESVTETTSLSPVSPWLDELRKLRVNELRLQLQHYDSSISLLETKVKRLEEEREITDLVSGLGEPVIKPVVWSDLNENSRGSCRGSCESVERVESVRRNESEEGGSDVQSSASLQRIESQPSISFLEIFLKEPCGSHFSRRLETQETLEYSKIIREHVDFEIIRKRLEEGGYTSSINKLFRDLLLLINHARVFYQKGTTEYTFAVQLNELVKKQMTSTLKESTRELSPPPKEKNSCLELVPFVVKDVAVTSKPVSVTLKPVSSKPRMSVPMVACRKRSSLATKPLLLLLPPGSDKKTEKDDDDKSLISKMVTGRKVAIRNIKKRDSGMSVDEVKKSDEEKKGSNKSGSAKKESAAARFLKRMRVGSSSVDSVVKEQNKSTGSNNKPDAKKRAVTGKTPRNMKASPVKRNNGRATKSEAAPSSYSSPVLGKRSREAGQEKEGGSSSTPSKKRVRK